ncbi:Gamma-aminobutyric acid type B receptor subunit 1 [Cichlidogyrus casuarinus]|uniref:Gamma-aminobutyric acid type B receptor subunit 2 n=1 Tax=Cichlidogyrus casuarinus TaxID=1844966 RepID=A0ABD2PY06_9PLAT
MDLLRFLLLIVSIISGTQSKKKYQIHIGATFPMSGDWPGGQACRPAAELAIQDINKQVKVLKDYELILHGRDSACLPGLGTKRMYELIYQEPKKIALLTGCSTVTTFVAEAANLWNLIVLAYGASSPALSNRTRFPTFFRTHPSASDQNPIRLRLIKQFDWKKITLLYQLEEVFASTIKSLQSKATEMGITITNTRSFQKNPSIHIQAIKNSTNSHNGEDSRIIIGLFYEKMAKKVFCDAYNSGLYGPKYVWIIIGWYMNDWWSTDLKDTNCTAAQMKLATHGHLTTESIMIDESKSKEFERLMMAQMPKGTPISSIGGWVEAPLAYDAVWALAHALDKAEKDLQMRKKSLLDFDYGNSEVKDVLYRELDKTDFKGFSGSVNFDASGSRISLNRVEQMLDGQYYTLGNFHSNKTDGGMEFERQPVWPNNKPPLDSPLLRPRYIEVSLWLYFGVYSGLPL